MKIVPNLYFIGGMRCGSTTLNLLLSQHPEIFMSPVKEPMYWRAEMLRANGETDTSGATRRYAEPEAYEGLFDGVTTERWIGESSHYIYAQGTAELIHAASPDARIIVSLRNPAERLFSEFMRGVRAGHFEGEFESFLRRNATFADDGRIVDFTPESRIGKGQQARLVKPWIEAFGADHVHFVLFEDLEDHAARTTVEIYRWLGVDDSFVPVAVHTQRSGVPRSRWLMKSLTTRKGPLKAVRRFLPRILREQVRSFVYSKTLERKELPPHLDLALRRFYEPDIVELERLTGRNLESWKVRALEAAA